MSGATKTSDRPNILLFVTEQHRYDALGVNGHPTLLTPTIDRLAATGTNFTAAYSTCPICVAARRSLLTGQHPCTHGVFDNRAVEFDLPTLPAELQRAGYQTAWVGRSSHQHPVRKHHGFEQMRIIDHRESPDDYDAWLNEHQPAGAGGHLGGGVLHNDWTARPWHMDDSLHHTHWTVNQALEFLSRRDPTRPFFLVVSFLAAHPPLQPPAFYMERYLRAGVRDPVIGDWAVPPSDSAFGPAPGINAPVDLRGEALLSTRAAYLGLINHLDDEIRRLFSEPDGVDRRTNGNTAVVLCSDHGEMLGDHYLWRKCYAYEGSAHIPLIVRPPVKWELPSGRRTGMPVSLEDVMPTVLEMAGVPCPGTVDGRSLVPVLEGERPAWRQWVRIESTVSGIKSLTDGREKYILHTGSGREQLFDLTKDPGELVDLVAEDGRGGGAQTATDAEGRLRVWRERLAEEPT